MALLKIGDEFLGRKILYLETFPGVPGEDGVFDSYRDATLRVKAMGYVEGSMERGHPIGFAAKSKSHHSHYISKWTNMTSTDHKSLDGVFQAEGGDYRNGTVQAIWFKEPIECPLEEVPFVSLTSEKNF